jgi:hypothetical protein
MDFFRYRVEEASDVVCLVVDRAGQGQH